MNSNIFSGYEHNKKDTYLDDDSKAIYRWRYVYDGF